MNASYQQLKRQPSSYVTALMLMVTLPHFQYIPSVSILGVIALSLWRLLISLKKLPAPNRLFSALITLFFAALVYQYEGGFTGITAGSHLLVMMTFCKLLESKSHRDEMLLIILSFFIVSTNFLYSQEIITAIYMFICLYVALYCLITVNQKHEYISLKNKNTLSTKMIVYSLPVMLILFIFFPRITGPLWKTSDDTQQAKTGLSDSMEPGQISKLIQSNELAFRAKFAKTPPSKKQLYWRALTLWDYDGKKWTRGNANEDEFSIKILDPGFEYTVTLEPHQKRWLFLLDLPYDISRPYQLISDFTAQSTKEVTKRLQYTAFSSTQFTSNQTLNLDNEFYALSVPEKNPLTRELAQSWRQQSSSDQEVIEKARQFFSTESFYYTLTPPGLTRTDSVDQFLFETRRGFCEHYASAFTVLMRHADIPSRIVLGYLGGQYNPLTAEYAIDQSMSHAWSEVWIENKGWVRVDPTAEIAPERVEQNLATALRDQVNLPLHLRINFPALENLRQLFDAIDSRWNQWFLDYNEKSQKQFLKFLTGNNLNLKEIGYLFMRVLLITLVISVVIYFFSSIKKRPDPFTLAYQSLCKKLARAGLEKSINEGPKDYQARIIKKIPRQKKEIEELFKLYIQKRYSRTNSTQTERQFIRAAKRFKVKKQLMVN